MSERPASYQQAVENANQAYKAGDRRAARKWAGAAAKLAPDQPVPWLMLAALAKPEPPLDWKRFLLYAGLLACLSLVGIMAWKLSGEMGSES